MLIIRSTISRMQRTIYLYSPHFKIYKMTSFITVTIYPFAFGFLCSFVFFYYESHET